MEQNSKGGSNLEKWINAVLNEDAKNLSIGSVRSLQMIKHKFEKLQKENSQLKKQAESIIPVSEKELSERAKNYSEGWGQCDDEISYRAGFRDSFDRVINLMNGKK